MHRPPRLRRASTEPRSFERGDWVCGGAPWFGGFASTEPRSFERGDNYYTSPNHLSINKLQRSRALSSAEILWGFFRSSTSAIASTEPRSFERGDINLARGSYWREYLLQRSRALSSAEMWRGAAGPSWPRRASTEPRSFERGDGYSTIAYYFNGSGFNGAALFRARRYHELRPLRHVRGCFNGAALFRARRWRCSTVAFRSE